MNHRTAVGYRLEGERETPNVRFGSKADMCAAKSDVRFTPKSGHVRCKNECPLRANSGHCQLLDHLVGTGKHRRWYREAKCLGGFEIYRQPELGRGLNGHLG